MPPAQPPADGQPSGRRPSAAPHTPSAAVGTPTSAAGADGGATSTPGAEHDAAVETLSTEALIAAFDEAPAADPEWRRATDQATEPTAPDQSSAARDEFPVTVNHGAPAAGKARVGWRKLWRQLLWGKAVDTNRVLDGSGVTTGALVSRTKLQRNALANMTCTHKGGIALFGEDHELAMERDDVLTKLVITREAALEDLAGRVTAKHDIFTGAFYLLFYMIFFWVIAGQTQTRNRYELEGAMTSYIAQAPFDDDGSVLEDIQNLDDVWSWLENAFVPAVFPEQVWYNGEEYSDTETGFLMEYNKLVGGFQLVQQKVISDHEECHVSPRFGQWAGHCYIRYDDSVRQEQPFGPSHDPHKYAFWEAYSEEQAGYHVQFPLDRKFAMRQLQELRDDKFLDKETRELVIDFTVYNENKHLFCGVTVHIMLLDSGLIETYFKLASVQAEHYASGSYARAVAEILIVLYIMIQLAVSQQQ
jgi:hypothetical protein